MIPMLEFLQEAWENMTALPKFQELHSAIEAGLENIWKWYWKVDDTDVYSLCLGASYLIITLRPDITTLVLSSIGPEHQVGVC